MKKNTVLIIVVAMLQLLVSCKDQGSKFLGNWVDIKTGTYHATITKSGKNFVIAMEGKQLPASYDETNDKLTVNDGTYTYTVIIDENSKYLLLAGLQLKKE